MFTLKAILQPQPSLESAPTLDILSPARACRELPCLEAVACRHPEPKAWNGHRYTDLFTLLKVDGVWKIMNKVFHQHP